MLRRTFMGRMRIHISRRMLVALVATVLLVRELEAWRFREDIL
jgi:hypothetical protein